jgi:membrane protein
LGKFLIGLYLGRSHVGSVFGAAGSLALVMIWIYYSAQILLFGAEFTQVFDKKFNRRAAPADNARPARRWAFWARRARSE